MGGKMKVKYAVIGLGFFGEKHAEVLSDMPGAELQAVCTRRPQRLKEIAGRFKVPKTYTNYKDLLADKEIDAVSIVTHVDGVAKLVHRGGKPGIRHIVGIKDAVQGVLLSIGNPSAIGHAFTITGPSPFSYSIASEYIFKKLDFPIVEFEYQGFHLFEIN